LLVSSFIVEFKTTGQTRRENFPLFSVAPDVTSVTFGATDVRQRDTWSLDLVGGTTTDFYYFFIVYGLEKIYPVV